MVVRTFVGDDVADAVGRESAATGMAAEAMASSTLYLLGTGAEVRETLRRWCHDIGISYVSLFDPGDEQIEYLAAEVVAPLGGHWIAGPRWGRPLVVAARCCTHRDGPARPRPVRRDDRTSAR